jgi:hypothetical protein
MCAVYLVMVRVAGEVTGSPLSLPPCVVGLSGPLFALKVLVILRSDRSALCLLNSVMDA